MPKRFDMPVESAIQMLFIIIIIIIIINIIIWERGNFWSLLSGNWKYET